VTTAYFFTLGYATVGGQYSVNIHFVPPLVTGSCSIAQFWNPPNVTCALCFCMTGTLSRCIPQPGCTPNGNNSTSNATTTTTTTTVPPPGAATTIPPPPPVQGPGQPEQQQPPQPPPQPPQPPQPQVPPGPGPQPPNPGGPATNPPAVASNLVRKRRSPRDELEFEY